MVELETERLRLRMWRLEDYEWYARTHADEEVMRYLAPNGKPMTRHEAWRSLAFIVGHWQLLGYGHWAVEEKSSGMLVGRVGFLNPEGWPGFELGWTLAREHWGRGFATEAARRAMDYAFDDLGRDHVISLIQPANQNSIRVAERLGEKPEGRTKLFGDLEVLIYGISREDWRAAASQPRA
ncbi:MAG TPA: GNAT family N-acetyltransferase [Pyrinomonadaceae bacterium]|nr:GNAT family N-acetyltransferase [Pyrinomonadaceae bacterium]